MTKDDKHKILNSIIMDIEKQKHILDRTFAFIQSTLISLEANEKLEGEEKDWLIKDLREKLNEREKATATLTYLKYKKMRDEMQMNLFLHYQKIQKQIVLHLLKRILMNLLLNLSHRKKL